MDMQPEYSALRNELLHNFASSNQSFALAVTATGVLLGIALQSRRKHWIVFLTPFAVLVPSIWFILSQIESAIRIATYIKVFMESVPQQGLQWETRLMDFRRVMQGTDRAYTYAVGYAYGALGIVSLLLSFLNLDTKNKKNFYAFFAVAVFLIVALSYPLLQILNVLGPKKFDHYIETWNIVKIGIK